MLLMAMNSRSRETVLGRLLDLHKKTSIQSCASVGLTPRLIQPGYQTKQGGPIAFRPKRNVSTQRVRAQRIRFGGELQSAVHRPTMTAARRIKVGQYQPLG